MVRKILTIRVNLGNTLYKLIINFYTVTEELLKTSLLTFFLYLMWKHWILGKLICTKKKQSHKNMWRKLSKKGYKRFKLNHKELVGLE
jgi:hypothetical protein